MDRLLGGSRANPSGLQLGPQGLIGALGVATLVLERLPGYDHAQRIIRGLGIDLNTAAAAVAIPTLLITTYNVGQSTVSALIEKYYSATVRINSEDSLFYDFFDWLAEEQMESIDLSRVFSAQKVSADHAGAGVGDGYGVEDFYYRDGPRQKSRGKQVYKVQYLPAAGLKYYFNYKGCKIRIIVEEFKDSATTVSGVQQQKTIWLRSYGRNPEILRKMLEEVLEKSNARDQGKTIVFHPNTTPRGMLPRWERALARPGRSMNTVVLEQEQKDMIIADIDEYIMPATAKWYANRGLPYRRGYLLYGPPGTGKTSLSMALAGHFNLEVYALSLSAGSLTDDTLASLFALLPSQCIVLLEDVDASHIKRVADEGPVVDPTDAFSIMNTPPPTSGNVSFSGLLNAIDGAASREGRILIMTTNHREQLDPALIRPGRVDLQVPFAYASRSVIKLLFLNLYDVELGDREALRMPHDFPERSGILALAAEFCERVPEGVFTPAEVQGLLLLHKKSPAAAVSAAKEWGRKMMESKGGKSKQDEVTGLRTPEEEPREELTNGVGTKLEQQNSEIKV